MFFIVGPCALESMEQIQPIVDLAKRWNIKYFRAQLFKPRTHPKSFQGLGEKGLPIIHHLLDNDFSLVCEAGSIEQLEMIESFVSVIQIGARNMQNFEFLKEIGKRYHRCKNFPHVLLKRGFNNSLDEWLASAQYLQDYGVPAQKIILCERGSRNFAAPSGVTIDFALAHIAKTMSSFPVIIDPSHGTRQSNLVLPLAKIALGGDFDGMMIEIHPRPKESWSDAQQAVALEDFESFLQQVNLTRFGIEPAIPFAHSISSKRPQSSGPFDKDKKVFPLLS